MFQKIILFLSLILLSINGNILAQQLDAESIKIQAEIRENEDKQIKYLEELRKLITQLRETELADDRTHLVKDIQKLSDSIEKLAKKEHKLLKAEEDKLSEINTKLKETSKNLTKKVVQLSQNATKLKEEKNIVITLEEISKILKNRYEIITSKLMLHAGIEAKRAREAQKKALQSAKQAREAQKKALEASKQVKIEAEKAKIASDIAKIDANIAEIHKQQAKIAVEKARLVKEEADKLKIENKMNALKEMYGINFIRYIKGEELNKKELNTVYVYLQLQKLSEQQLPSSFEEIMNEIKGKIEDMK